MTTLNIVAHPDDDILFLGSDIAEDLERGEFAHILYLTQGDDGDKTIVSVHRWALDKAYELTTGMPLILGIHSNSFRNGDIEGSLYRMWHNPEHNVETLMGERLNHDLLLWFLRGYISRSVTLVRIQDPDCEPNLTQDSKDGDHVDHIYGAKFAQEACKAFPHLPVYAYTSYPIRFMPPNLNAHQIELKTKMWRAYQSVDTSVAGEQWDIALSRCYKRRMQ